MRVAFARLLLVLLLVPKTARAWCDQNTDYSVPAEFSRSQIVANVQVTRTTWLDEHRNPTRLRAPLMLGDIPGGLDPYAGATYDARVLRMFKGPSVQHLQIFSENSDARTPLETGEKYLVFLYRDLAEIPGTEGVHNDLMIDYCGNSRLLYHAGKMLGQVERLSQRSNR